LPTAILQAGSMISYPGTSRRQADRTTGATPRLRYDCRLEGCALTVARSGHESGLLRRGDTFIALEILRNAGPASGHESGRDGMLLTFDAYPGMGVQCLARSFPRALGSLNKYLPQANEVAIETQHAVLVVLTAFQKPL
jgi:hypothetical protein